MCVSVCVGVMSAAPGSSSVMELLEESEWASLDPTTPIPQDMRGRYEASQELLGSVRKQLSDSEGERRGLEEQLQRLRDQTAASAQAQEDAQREAQRLRSANELLSRCGEGGARGAGRRRWASPARPSSPRAPTSQLGKFSFQGSKKIICYSSHISSAPLPRVAIDHSRILLLVLF